MQEWLFALRWWFILELVGLITFPLVARVGRNLWDKGYCIAKPVGVLLLTYLVWMMSSLHLMKFGYPSVLAALLLVGVASFCAGRKYLSASEIPLKRMIWSSSIFLVAFLLFAFILRYKPDYYFAYSEDFIDFGLTKAILRTDFFPPQDPWMAGMPTTWYYGGFLIAATLIKLTSVTPFIGQNLAVATFFALSATTAYGIGSNTTRKNSLGLLAAVMVCAMGYLSGAFELAAYLTKHDLMGYRPIGAANWWEWLLSFNFWEAGGIIPGTLNHYPYFPYLQADMHPPIMGFPFQLTFVVFIIVLVRAELPNGTALWEALLLVFLMALNLGFLFFINTWDYPVHIGALILAMVLLKRRLLNWLVAGAVMLWSLVLFAPYLARGGVPGGMLGIGLIRERTPLSSLLEMMPLFLFVIFSLLFLLAKRIRVGVHWIVLLASLLAMAIFFARFPLLSVLVPMIVAGAYLALKPDVSPEDKLPLFFSVVGAIVVFLVDIFYVKDALSGPAYRYNTVLKLYYGVWLFWGIASAIAIGRVAEYLHGIWKYAWLSIVSLFVLASLVHPLAATTAWTGGRHQFTGFNRGTLDGAAYLKSIHPADYEAIRWLDANAAGSPVVLEAPGAAYSYSSRVASLTGLPTLIGWQTHEIMWRGDWKAVEERTRDANYVYDGSDISAATGLLGKYGVKYVFVGEVERQKYSKEGLAKFGLRPDLFKLIYDKGGVQVYEVIYE